MTHRESAFFGATSKSVTGLAIAFLVVAAAILISACGDDKPVATAEQGTPEEILKKNCADPKWKEQNLGLWYSVCRQPLRW